MHLLNLDIHTIIDLLFIGNLVSAAILLAYKGDLEHRTPYRQFFVGKLLQAVAWLLLGHRGEIAQFLSVQVGNTLLIAGFALESLALATAKKTSRQLTILYALLAAGGIVVFLFFAAGSGWLRIALASSVTILLYGTTALLILRSIDSSFLHRTIGIGCFLFSFILIFRVGIALFDQNMTLMSNTPIQTLSFLPLYLLMLAGGIGFILLLKEYDDLLLRESEEKYRTLVERANEAIIIVQDRKFVFANQRMAEILSTSVTDLIGKTFPDFLWPEDRERVLTNYERRMRGEQFTNKYDFRIIGPDGNPVWLALSATIIQWLGRPASLNLMTDITERKHLEGERETIILELQQALSEIKTLSGLLPICASCKKIRDDKGYWNQIETYVKAHSNAQFTHGICPDCMQKLYPEVYEKMQQKEAGEKGRQP